jgi:hypothetical protein
MATLSLFYLSAVCPSLAIAKILIFSSGCAKCFLFQTSTFFLSTSKSHHDSSHWARDKQPRACSQYSKGHKYEAQREREEKRRDNGAQARCTYFPETDIPRVKYPGIWQRPAPIMRPIQRRRERLSTAHGGIQSTVEVAPHRQPRHHRQAARRRCRGMSSSSTGTGMRASRMILRTLEITIRTLWKLGRGGRTFLLGLRRLSSSGGRTIRTGGERVAGVGPGFWLQVLACLLYGASGADSPLRIF